jgi:hypothetical protein
MILGDKPFISEVVLSHQLRKYYVWYLYMIEEAQFFLSHKTDIVSSKNLAFLHV